MSDQAYYTKHLKGNGFSVGRLEKDKSNLYTFGKYHKGKNAVMLICKDGQQCGHYNITTVEDALKRGNWRLRIIDKSIKLISYE